MRYFAEIETLGELKKEFHRLAMENHPDQGAPAVGELASLTDGDSIYKLPLAWRCLHHARHHLRI